LRILLISYRRTTDAVTPAVGNAIPTGVERQIASDAHMSQIQSRKWSRAENSSHSRGWVLDLDSRKDPIAFRKRHNQFLLKRITFGSQRTFVLAPEIRQFPPLSARTRPAIRLFRRKSQKLWRTCDCPISEPSICSAGSTIRTFTAPLSLS
jgi:hypothetical protein